MNIFPEFGEIDASEKENGGSQSICYAASASAVFIR